jgi:hypothetical protein
MRHTKTFEKFELTEGPEKGNQKFVTSDRPKVAPAPQSIQRRPWDDEEKEDKYYVIDAYVKCGEVLGILGNNDIVKTLPKEEKELLDKLKADLEDFLDNTSLY